MAPSGRRAITVAAAVVVALVAVTVAAELALPAWTASRIEHGIADETAGRLTVDATVSGPPLLVPGLLTGRVDRIAVAVDTVAGRDPGVDVTVELTGVHVRRGALLRGDVEVTRVEHARVVVAFDLGEVVPDVLEPLAGQLATIGFRELIRRFGDLLPVRLDGDRLELGSDLSLGLAGGVDGCEVAAERLRVTATCQLVEVPPLLLRVLQ